MPHVAMAFVIITQLPVDARFFFAKSCVNALYLVFKGTLTLRFREKSLKLLRNKLGEQLREGTLQECLPPWKVSTVKKEFVCGNRTRYLY